jgi:hypothetical protein
VRPPSRAGVRFASAVLLALPIILAGTAPATCQLRTPHTPPADLGRDLFTGRAQFQNRGLACGACHSISTIGFPNGGLVGPDLSGAYEMLGPDGIDATLQTLFFPTMLPLYNGRPLTPDEQLALKAFLQQARGSSGAQRDTPVMAGLGLCGFLVLMAIAWLTWRRRLRAVRARLALDTGLQG